MVHSRTQRRPVGAIPGRHIACHDSTSRSKTTAGINHARLGTYRTGSNSAIQACGSAEIHPIRIRERRLARRGKASCQQRCQRQPNPSPDRPPTPPPANHNPPPAHFHCPPAQAADSEWGTAATTSGTCSESPSLGGGQKSSPVRRNSRRHSTGPHSTKLLSSWSAIPTLCVSQSLLMTPRLNL